MSMGQRIRPYIACHPQSRWELVSKTDTKVELAKKNILICLEPEDFERGWVEVKEKRMKKNEQAQIYIKEKEITCI